MKLSESDASRHGQAEVISLVDLQRDGSGVVLDLTEDGIVRDAAAAWHRVRLFHGTAERQDFDAALIRPDGCVAWVLPAGAAFDAESLRLALRTWFGAPRLA
jgi:lipopolysaccharide biosynthesis protein